jgi:hypothetical protein
VTDDDGTTATVTHTVNPTAPPAVQVAFRAAAGSNTNSASPSVVVPASVQAGDTLVLVLTTNRAATLTVPAGWSQVGTVADGSDVRSWVLTRAAVAATAGSTVRVTLDATSKTAVSLLAYRNAGTVSAVGAAETGAATTTSHAAPAVTVATAGSAVVRYWADKANTAHDWTLPGSVTARNSSSGTPSGLVNAAAGDQLAVAAGPVGAASASSAVGSAKAIAWSIVVAPS